MQSPSAASFNAADGMALPLARLLSVTTDPSDVEPWPARIQERSRYYNCNGQTAAAASTSVAEAATSESDIQPARPLEIEDSRHRQDHNCQACVRRGGVPLVCFSLRRRIDTTVCCKDFWPGVSLDVGYYVLVGL